MCDRRRDLAALLTIRKSSPFSSRNTVVDRQLGQCSYGWYQLSQSRHLPDPLPTGERSGRSFAVTKLASVPRRQF